MRLLVIKSIIAAVLLANVVQARADSVIVIAIRYLQAEGTSHAHLYLYRKDGRFLRQLTNDNSGQDVDPNFTPDGGTIVFTREMPDKSLEFWSVEPLSTALKKLSTAPAWYIATRTSPYFTNRDGEKSTEQSPAASATPGSQAPTYKTPDDSIELVLRTVPEDEEDRYDGPGHGKHYLVRHLKAGIETEMGQLPGFYGLYGLLHESQDKDRHFLFEDALRVASLISTSTVPTATPSSRST